MKLTTHYSRLVLTERLRPLCTDYFNNMRPVHNAASDEQITSKKAWREQKKWILISVKMHAGRVYTAYHVSRIDLVAPRPRSILSTWYAVYTCPLCLLTNIGIARLPTFVLEKPLSGTGGQTDKFKTQGLCLSYDKGITSLTFKSTGLLRARKCWGISYFSPNVNFWKA